MSIGSFFSKVASWFKRLFKAAPQAEHIALATITYVAPIVEGILALVDPPAAAIVTPIITVVERDLSTVAATIQDGMPAAGSSAEQAVESALNAIKSNIGGLLQVAEVKNSAKITEITTAVNTITGEVDAILGSLGTAPAAA